MLPTTDILPTPGYNTTIKTADDQIVTIFARIKDRPGVLAVSIPPRGATKYFCQVHRRVFEHNSACPDCEAK
jgi:hypothetical protein